MAREMGCNKNNLFWAMDKWWGTTIRDTKKDDKDNGGHQKGWWEALGGTTRVLRRMPNISKKTIGTLGQCILLPPPKPSKCRKIFKRGIKKLETFIACWNIGRDVEDILRHLGRHLGSLGCLKRWPLSIVSHYIQSKVGCKLYNELYQLS